ncbi:PREDICTED: uncharacterized protein LOC105107869 [Populus euphratica]|uniref:Uncharacterized protein LOC105107869 n=1 Tax=Populus euphratica TaxID=75702 RepID=A0AAJ6SWF7_POPEU|nr:PREDICTED: uncharacterized protein LOC105107869 [Populus euphratica]XP_011000243.1 PREDICTED: uncharacterized protein LOC105107869 [Populus euphratica]XP_011000244.1 PREDICTED: uncharacterized protein LOC105107869 [Populus euphratica]
MAQEEQTKKCNTSSNGNGDGGIRSGHISRSSRKHKQKKVPQRGLGVAQLEKIRLEEQQKNDVSVNLPSPAPISQIKPSNLSMPVPNSYESRSTSIPYLPDLSSPNSMFRPQNIELINSNSTIPPANSVGWQSAAVQGQKNMPKMWNSSYYNLEKENCGVDPALAFRPNLNLPYESNPIWPLPSLMQRAQQHRQHSSSSSCSMVNASSGSSSSSLQNPQMEPPSNQSYYDNYIPVWIEEEKMVGKKRPHPFSLGYPPGSSFHCYKCPTNTSFGNGGLYNFSFSSRNCREDSSCSTCILEPTSKKIIKENGACNVDFIAPAPPPATTLTSIDFKLKPSAYLDFHNFESFDFDSLPYQGNVEDQILQQPGAIVPNQQQTYYCFLPPAIMQIGHPTKSSNGYTGDEVGENIDLNLKL